MQRVAEDVTDPSNQKVAIAFFTRCVTIWGQPGPASDGSTNGQQGTNQSLPGFDRFIYERLIPTAFRVPSFPNFNPKDGQMILVSPGHKHSSLPNLILNRFFTKLLIFSRPSAKLGALRPTPFSWTFFCHLKTGQPKQPWTSQPNFETWMARVSGSILTISSVPHVHNHDSWVTITNPKLALLSYSRIQFICLHTSLVLRSPRPPPQL